MSQPERPDLGKIMQALCDSEISGEVLVSWFFDRVWEVKLGDRANGYDAEETVNSAQEAADWLRETAVRLYPDSEFCQAVWRPRVRATIKRSFRHGYRRPC